MPQIIVAYVPVLHSGYLKFFDENKGDIFLVDSTLVPEINSVARDLRAIPIHTIRELLLFYFSQRNERRTVTVAHKWHLTSIRQSYDEVVMPDEDISRFFASRFLRGHPSITFRNVFLRWNWGNVTKEAAVAPDMETTSDQVIVDLMLRTEQLADRSSDWWRHIGALLVRNGEVLVEAYNKHFPSEHSPYALGDPRSSFNPGERIDISSAHHAEKEVIAMAARRGIATEGASIVVTTFPCPGCAMDIVTAGIKTVYYSAGYSLVGAQEILRSRGVRLVRVVAPPLL